MTKLYFFLNFIFIINKTQMDLDNKNENANPIKYKNVFS